MYQNCYLHFGRKFHILITLPIHLFTSLNHMIDFKSQSTDRKGDRLQVAESAIQAQEFTLGSIPLKRFELIQTDSSPCNQME